MRLILRLAWRNVWRNPRRTGLTVSATVFAVLLVIVFVSMGAGIHEQMIEDAVRLSSGHASISGEGYLENRTLEGESHQETRDFQRETNQLLRRATAVSAELERADERAQHAEVAILATPLRYTFSH